MLLPNLDKLQANLKARGYYLGEVDGQPGRFTFQAMAEYLTDSGAPDDIGIYLAKWIPKGAIDISRARLIAFFAHGAHESGFRPVAENLNYSVDGLINGFGRHRISIEDAQRYGRMANRPANQQAIANIIYGGPWGKENLGNLVYGDGWKHRGMGIMQNTGRTSQAASGRAVGIDLQEDAEQLLTKDGAVAGAVGFWIWKKINAIVDQPGDTTMAETRAINGGLKGLAERAAMKAKLRAVWPV